MMSSAPQLERASPAHRRKRRKDERPAQLLDAALLLFVEKGYAATRIEEVAAKAGVSKGTVFLYFPTKLELFKQVVRRNISGRLAQWDGRFAEFAGSSGELLRLTMLLWWERIGSTPASGISKLMVSEGHHFPEMAEFFHREVIVPGQSILRRLIERGIERGEFRPVCVEHAVQGMVSVMVFLALSRQSDNACTRHFNAIDPVAYLNHHADVMARGLAAPLAQPKESIR